MKQLQIGEKLDIVYSRNNAEDSICYTMVQDICDKNEFIITQPLEGFHPVLLNINESVKIIYYRPNGQFYFYARVTERFAAQNLIFLRLLQASKSVRLQRRNDYRLNTTLPLTFRVINDITRSDTLYKGHTLDISGGGMKFQTDILLHIKDILICTIEIPHQGIAEITGCVIRRSTSEDINYKYEIGFRMTDNHPMKEKIIKYIFDEQRRLCQKGLLSRNNTWR